MSKYAKNHVDKEELSSSDEEIKIEMVKADSKEETKSAGPGKDSPGLLESHSH